MLFLNLHFHDLGIPDFNCPNIKKTLKSDRRDSNPRFPPWQGGTLPTEPLSHIYLTDKSTTDIACQKLKHNHHQCDRLSFLHQSHKINIHGTSESDRRDSNPRFPPWQGGALPTEPLSRTKSINKKYDSIHPCVLSTTFLFLYGIILYHCCDRSEQ